jgi:hypothetical protein
MSKRRVTKEPSTRIVDKELQDSLLVKATKTAAAEQKQEQRNHELYQAVFSKPKPDTSTPGNQDHQRLAQLVVAYQAHFGTHVPLEAMKVLQVIDLLLILMDALATNTPLAETGWAPMELGPRGCIIDRAAPTKLPSGEWLN